MSIASLVTEYGTMLYLHRPTMSVSSDGKPMRTYAYVVSARGFIQPSAQSQERLEGRLNGRTAATIYFTGTLDVRIDDELYTGTSGTVDRWRVTGATNPGEVGRNFSVSHRLNMTVVEAVQVDPSISL